MCPIKSCKQVSGLRTRLRSANSSTLGSLPRGIWLLACAAALLTPLPAQTTVPQLAVTTDTAIDSTLVATGGTAADGDTYKPTIAGSGDHHRDALYVTDSATLTLTSGANVTVKNDDNFTSLLRVGYGDGKSGTMIIDSGASLTVGQLSRHAGLHVAEGAGATGSVQQTGGEVTVRGSFNVGVNGGDGTFTLSGGQFTLDHDDNPANKTSLATIGYNNLGAGSPATTGTLNISGGTFVVTAHQWDPADNPGKYGSVSLILGNRTSGAPNYGSGDGTLNQTGGTLRVESPAMLFLSSMGNGTYNLNGGTLEIGGTSLRANYNSGTGSYAFNLGGGTIKVIGGALNTSVNATLTEGTISGFDTNGLGATWSGNISGTGGLIKGGEGTLTLSGTSRSFGFFNAAQGATAQTAGTTTSPEFTVGSGLGADGSFTLSGGSLVIDGLPPFGGGSSGLRVGDFGGTGVMTQTGGSVVIGSATVAGSLNVGNQGGTGTYNLSGGTLTLAEGLHNLGRNTQTTTTSHGTFNLSGGLVEVTGNSSFILGDRDSSGLTGTGTLVQTGGTLRVSDGWFYLSAYGDGSYSLNGGTLEIGGNRLVARYAGSGSHTFNLGGGTIKVIGSNLTSSVAASLTASTTSTIDTNGFNATWSGQLSGDGSLAKIGTGTLTLSHASNSYAGTTNVNGGILNLTGGLQNSTVVVGNGGTLRGNGNAAGVTVLSGGTFEPGVGVGTFTVNGDLTFNDGSTLRLDLNSLVRGSGYDYLTVTGGLTLNGTLNLSLGSGLTLKEGDSIDILDWGYITGTFDSLLLPNLDAGLGWDTSLLYTTGTLSITTAAAIPEPTTVALLAGLAALGLAAWRRQRGY